MKIFISIFAVSLALAFTGPAFIGPAFAGDREDRKAQVRLQDG